VIGPNQDREVDLVPCGPSPLKINSNITEVSDAAWGSLAAMQPPPIHLLNAP
jgi:hypothetical protein